MYFAYVAGTMGSELSAEVGVVRALTSLVLYAQHTHRLFSEAAAIKQLFFTTDCFLQQMLDIMSVRVILMIAVVRLLSKPVGGRCGLETVTSR